jgi:hypothetical protein
MSDIIVLDKFIAKCASFLYKTGTDKQTFDDRVSLLFSQNKIEGLSELVSNCLVNSFIHISKNAENEKQFYELKLEFDQFKYEFETTIHGMDGYAYLQQIHLDKLLILKHTLLYNFDVEINSNECCKGCFKKDKKKFSLEKAIAKKPLPNPKCTRPGGCNCFYSPIPKLDHSLN